MAFFESVPMAQGVYLGAMCLVIRAMEAASGVAGTTYLFYILRGSRRNLCFSLHLAFKGLAMIAGYIFLGVLLDHGPDFFGLTSTELVSKVFVFVSFFNDIILVNAAL